MSEVQISMATGNLVWWNQDLEIIISYVFLGPYVFLAPAGVRVRNNFV